MAVRPEQVEDALREIGLSDVEVQVYTAGLQMGPRPASAIAQKAGLKRSQTYNVLALLCEKGIAQEIEKNSIRHYSFSPPEMLFSILESKEEEIKRQKEQLKNIVPFLEMLKGNGQVVKPRLRFYKGIEGVREVFNDMLETPDTEILGVLDLRHSATATDLAQDEAIRAHIKKREEKNISWRGLAVDSEISRAVHARRPSKLRKTKLVADDLSLKSEVHVYGHKVAFTSTYQEKVGVIIENEPIADSIRSLIELLYTTLPGDVVEG